MKKMLMTAAALVVLNFGASAADLPSRSAPASVAAQPAFTWTGFYLGLNAGYGGDSFNYPIKLTVPAVPAAVGANANLTSSGILAGAQAGYNYQMGAFVVGVEADFGFANISGKLDLNAAAVAGGFGAAGGVNIGSEIENLGTVRARLGYAWDRALFYVTGGWAYGNVSTSISAGGNAGLLPGGGFSYSKTNMQNGWTLGAGVEYAFTNNLTFKTEYLYADLGKGNVYSRVYNSGSAVNWDVEAKAHIVRAGLNYKF
jgi:outer membrane immunogenic protein